MQEEGTTRWAPQQMAHLLGIGDDNPLPGDPADQDRLTAELLREHLASPTLLDEGVGQRHGPTVHNGPVQQPPGLLEFVLGSETVFQEVLLEPGF